MQNKLSVGECIRFGWETFKKRPWFLVGLVFIILALNIVSSVLSNSFAQVQSILLIVILSVASMVLSIVINLAMIKLLLKSHDSIDTVQYSDGLPPRPFWKYVFASLIQGVVPVAAALIVLIPVGVLAIFLSGTELMGVIFVIGIIAAVIAAVYAALVLLFTPYILIDRSTGIIEALDESRKITKGNVLKLVVLFLALGLLNLLGLLAIIVGLFVTIPITYLAVVHAYRTLAHKANEIAPAMPVAPVTSTASVA